MTTPMLALLLSLQATDPASPRSIEVGQAIRGSIGSGNSTVTTALIEQNFPPIPFRSERFRFLPPATGRYYIDLRSLDFDAYLIVRDIEGNLLAEDDDAVPLTQSRLAMDFEAGESYSIHACAGHGAVGEFVISVGSGEPPSLSPEERSIWENDPRATASILRLRAAARLNRGNVAEAEQLFAQAMKAVAERLGERGHESAACFYSYGSFLARRHELARARELIEKAVRIQEELLGPEDLQTCHSYAELGMLLDRTGDRSGADRLFEKALVGFKREAATGDTARIRYAARRRCAEIALRQGDWVRCEAILLDCLSSAGKTYGADSIYAIDDLVLLGACVLLQGDSTKAKTYYRGALAIQDRSGAGPASTTWEIRTRLAGVLASEGNRADAQRLLETNLQEMEAKGNPDELALANASTALGNIYESKGEYDRAKIAHERALAIFEKLLGERSDNAAEACRSLARIAMESLEFEKAADLLQRAQAAGGGDTSSALAARFRTKILADLGRLSFLRGQLDEAKRAYEKSLESAAEPSTAGTRAIASIYHDLACLQIEAGDFEAAWESAVEAYARAESALQQAMRSLSEPERYECIASQRIAMETILSLAQERKDPESSDFAFDALSTWKARVFRGMLAVKQRAFRGLDAEGEGVLNRLRSVQSQISAIFSSRDLKDLPVAAQRMESLQRLRGELEKEVLRRFGPREEAPIDWRALRAALPPGASFINFVEHSVYKPSRRERGRVIEKPAWGEPQISAWVLHAESAYPVRVTVGPSAEVEDLIQEFLRELLIRRPSRFVSPDERWKALNEEVFRRIWLPIAAQIRGDLVFVSSDGCMGLLPLGVLQQPNGRHLIEDYRFVCMQEASGLMRSAKRPLEREGGLLVVGGVDFGVPSADARKAWLALPQTEAEAKAIFDEHQRNVAEQPRLFLADDAPTEERLKSELSRFAFVHVASHGFFKPRAMGSFWDRARVVSSDNWGNRSAPVSRYEGFMPGLLSGLVCAGANLPQQANREDGLLTAEEVSWLDLSRCQLVALSACETGLGTVRAGEGIVGLRSAFRQAGAKTAICSLWSVGDHSTKILMRRFYEALWRDGRGRLAALREAQLEAIAEQRRLHDGRTFPYAWGAFVLDGDWR